MRQHRFRHSISERSKIVYSFITVAVLHRHVRVHPLMITAVKNTHKISEDSRVVPFLLAAPVPYCDASSTVPKRDIMTVFLV